MSLWIPSKKRHMTSKGTTLLKLQKKHPQQSKVNNFYQVVSFFASINWNCKYCHIDVAHVRPHWSFRQKYATFGNTLGIEFFHYNQLLIQQNQAVASVLDFSLLLR